MPHTGTHTVQVLAFSRRSRWLLHDATLSDGKNFVPSQNSPNPLLLSLSNQRSRSKKKTLSGTSRGGGCFFVGLGLSFPLSFSLLGLFLFLLFNIPNSPPLMRPPPFFRSFLSVVDVPLFRLKVTPGPLKADITASD